MEDNLEPEINEIEKSRHKQIVNDFFSKLVIQGEKEVKKARKKAVMTIIPIVIVCGMALIGLGILIGKFLL